jgi:hypothetical protein
MLPECLRNYVSTNENSVSAEEANQLVFSLQVLEVITPSLNQKLIAPIMESLNSMCLLLANPYKTVRHMTSRCIAVLASLNTKEVCY